MLNLDQLKVEAIDLLKGLIRTPSFSGDEDKTAMLLSVFLQEHGISHIKKNNNVLVGFDQINPQKPTCLLNSHHDTVKVVSGWERDPFGAEIADGRLYGLGSNDAGASLVSLLAAYLQLYREDLPYNLVFIASGEEENFGPNGIKSLLEEELSRVNFGIVGEPTNMEIAVAEKGLLVIDGEANGKAGHAARQEGENAIYKAIKDIELLSEYRFSKVSNVLGPNVMTVTQVQAGYQHNVVPDSCKFVIDLRVNECYSLEEAFEEVQEICGATLKARSFNNRSSGIALEHPLVKAGQNLNIRLFGSATLSDQANLPFPTIKMGPGFSERSHTPDEFIKLDEIRRGIDIYLEFLQEVRMDNSIKA